MNYPIKGYLLGYIVALATCACATIARAQEIPVRFVQEIPWTVSALGISEEALPVLAYWEPGQRQYYLALAAYLDLLGFHVVTDSLQLEATRYRKRFMIETTTGAAMRGSDVIRLDSTEYFVSQGEFYVSFGGLQQLFLPDPIQFDRSRLHITHAAAAPVLQRRPSVQAGPLRFGRSRPVWGNTRLDYRVTRTQWQMYEPTYHGFVRTNTNALGGRLLAEGLLSQTDRAREVELRTLSYLLDFPGSARLTQVEAGRLNFYGWPLQTTYDGVRLSNLPVADRYVQRDALIDGVADPGAVVTAKAGGGIVDRVYADEDGNYTVRVPAYYGSSQVQVEIAPADGGNTTTRIHHLYVSEDIPPPGTLYWDARVGRDTTAPNDLLAIVEARYGLTPTLAARAAFVQSGAPRVGLTKSWRGMSADAEVALPMDAARMRVWAQSRRVRLQAEAALAEKSTQSYYHTLLSGHLGWQFERGSLFLQATRFTTIDDNTENTSLIGSITARISSTTSALLTGGLSRWETANLDSQPWQWRWGSSVTRTLTRGTRVGMHGEGGLVNNLDFVGAAMHVNWRWVSFGLRTGYDQGLATSFTIRVDAPWASITNRSAVGPGSSPSHSQSIYGSMELGRTLRLSRRTQARSSALLQAFFDTDRDGRKDSDESVIEGVDIKVAHAHVRLVSPGKVRADLLVPHQQYQVTVDSRSLTNPRLALTTGEQFSFVADPGQTKRINIPVQRYTLVDGRFDELPTYSAARLLVFFFKDDIEIARAEVSQEGRFSARLAPGLYRVVLKDLFDRVDLSGNEQRVEVLEQPEQVLRLVLPSSDDT